MLDLVVFLEAVVELLEEVGVSFDEVGAHADQIDIGGVGLEVEDVGTEGEEFGHVVGDLVLRDPHLRLGNLHTPLINHPLHKPHRLIPHNLDLRLLVEIVFLQNVL